MINSAMAFVLLKRRSFTATMPLPQNSDDKMLLATISRSFHRSFEYLCVPQPPDTTFARDREMRLWATWPAPTPRSIQADVRQFLEGHQAPSFSSISIGLR